ncbi:MAG: hypothetical protein BMS9Abin39_0502 [Ignavibacteria bacterium]|nr:MAG: hypothetical protein BMS9Abin39_0502 [Ignavibacteria bacterium]
MKNKIPIFLITHDRPYLLPKVLDRLINFTNLDEFEIWILDNASKLSTKKIISAYTEKYKFINVFTQEFNQISIIQNSIIGKLKRDLYIKLDDDILVTKNWHTNFINVFERNKKDISIGSVVIPINGFGWVPFLEIMKYKKEFQSTFSNIELIKGCMEPAVWNNNEVCEFIWKKCIRLNQTAETFLDIQKNNYTDFVVPHRYSIGAIIFSHNFWEKMSGWKVYEEFDKQFKLFKILTKINNSISKIRNKKEQKRIPEIIRILTNINVSALGVEEDHLFRYSIENGFKQYVTTEGIVYHFSFSPVEEYLMRKIFLDIEY